MPEETEVETAKAEDSAEDSRMPGLDTERTHDVSSQDLPGVKATASEPKNDSKAPSSEPSLSRTSSFTAPGATTPFDEDYDAFGPVESLTVFDFLENLALPYHLEKLQKSAQARITAQAEKVRRHQQRLKSGGLNAKDRVIDEWRRRLPTSPDEQLDKYKKQVKQSLDRLTKRWGQSSAVTTREKVSFIAGVMNVFISGYLIGGRPGWFHYWYTAQLCYFMPIRYITYHRKGYQYFLADLCYFVNLLTMLSIWVFPQSKRLFISTYCLAMGNNAIAIAMWRNSMVFHSLDKVTSLFIHIMPCVALHCLVHLLPASELQSRYPAIYTIKFSAPSSPEHYTLPQMITWATIPYGIWQLTYHLLITVRRREQIAAGRPTSFTYLRKSYSPTLLGKMVLSLPNAMQEPAFMMIQYSYAMLTMIPCPIWFWYRRLSAGFLVTVFAWSVYNGATYYIDVFGKRFEKELEKLRADMQKWQSPESLLPTTPGSAEPLVGTERGTEDVETLPPLDPRMGDHKDRSGEVLRHRK